jgi:hypothetical protein
MAEPWGDRVILGGDGFYDHISGADSGADGEPYLCEVAVKEALPDQIDIYRAIKKSGARKHGEIAKVIADMLKITPLVKETDNGRK